VTLENGKLVGQQVKPSHSKPAPPPENNLWFELNAEAEDGSMIDRNTSGVAYPGRWRFGPDQLWIDCLVYPDTSSFSKEAQQWFSLTLQVVTHDADWQWRWRTFIYKLIDPIRLPNQ
jgi:hypothetical protein